MYQKRVSCDVCGKDFVVIDDGWSYYPSHCPHCGAKKKVEKE